MSEKIRFHIVRLILVPLIGVVRWRCLPRNDRLILIYEVYTPEEMSGRIEYI